MASIHNNGIHDPSPVPPDDLKDSQTIQEQNPTEIKTDNIKEVISIDASDQELLFNAEELSGSLSEVEEYLSSDDELANTMKIAEEIEDQIPLAERNKAIAPPDLHPEKASDQLAKKALEDITSNIENIDSKQVKKQPPTLREKAASLWASFKNRAKELTEKFPDFPKPTFPAFKTNLAFQLKFPDFHPKAYLKTQSEEVTRRLVSGEDSLYHQFNAGGKQILNALGAEVSAAKEQIKNKSSQLKRNIKKENDIPSENIPAGRQRGYVDGKARVAEMKETKALHDQFKDPNSIHSALGEISTALDALKRDKDKKLKFIDGKFDITDQSSTYDPISKSIGALLEEIINNKENNNIQDAYGMYLLLYRFGQSDIPQLKKLAEEENIKEGYLNLEKFLSTNESIGLLTEDQVRFIFSDVDGRKKLLK